MLFLESFAIAALVYWGLFELARSCGPREMPRAHPLFVISARRVWLPMDTLTRRWTRETAALAIADAAKIAEQGVLVAAPPVIPDACSICLDDVTDTMPLRQIRRCGHVFCARCLSEWFSRRLSCPLCNCDVAVTDLESDRVERMDWFMLNQA